MNRVLQNEREKCSTGRKLYNVPRVGIVDNMVILRKTALNLVAKRRKKNAQVAKRLKTRTDFFVDAIGKILQRERDTLHPVSTGLL